MASSRRDRSSRSLKLLLLGGALTGCLGSNEPSSDGSPPQVRIDAPLAGATVSSTVSIDITAIDDFGVDQVRVLVDGVLLTTMFTRPFHTTLNTQTLINNSTHVIRAEALDVAQNIGSAQISVLVSNGPQSPPAAPR